MIKADVKCFGAGSSYHQFLLNISTAS